MSARKVVIIEDDAAIATMYALKLKHDGYIVEVAADGETGIALVLQIRPDIILLDIMMPAMNGVEVMTRLRQYPEAENAKVIVLTNMDSSEMGKEVHNLGAVDYVVKAGATPQQISEKIKRLLKPKPSYTRPTA